MQTEAAEISVIMPVFNGERYLGEAIESVLAQTHPGVELIVIDDGSEDDSLHVVERYAERLTHVRRAHGGIGAARNHGVALSRGRLLAFLDCDDLYPPDRLSVLHAGFDTDPRPDIVVGHVKQFLSPELADRLKQQIRCAEQPMPGTITTCMLIPRDVFERVGPFETKWRVGIDMEWYMRAVDKGVAFRTLSDVILLRRLHDRNNGQVQRAAFGERMHILKAAIERRRSQAAPDGMRKEQG